MNHALNVLVSLPAHANISGPLTYLHSQPLDAGTLVRVPFGKGEVLGVVWYGGEAYDASNQQFTGLVLKPITSVIEGIDALDSSWLGLVEFAAAYYQRSLGEMALQALPPQ